MEETGGNSIVILYVCPVTVDMISEIQWMNVRKCPIYPSNYEGKFLMSEKCGVLVIIHHYNALPAYICLYL